MNGRNCLLVVMVARVDDTLPATVGGGSSYDFEVLLLVQLLLLVLLHLWHVVGVWDLSMAATPKCVGVCCSAVGTTVSTLRGHD